MHLETGRIDITLTRLAGRYSRNAPSLPLPAFRTVSDLIRIDNGCETFFFTSIETWPTAADESNIASSVIILLLLFQTLTSNERLLGAR
jgi:hypothetical protein